MSNRLLRAVLALYPRGFRRRYGPEVQGLVNDLEAAGERSPLRLVSGLLVSAVAERLRTLRLDAPLTIAAILAVAALSTIVGLSWSRAGQHAQQSSARDSTYLLAAAGPAAPPPATVPHSTAPPTPGTSAKPGPAAPPPATVPHSTAPPTPGTSAKPGPAAPPPTARP
jgi:hypothetical protein